MTLYDLKLLIEEEKREGVISTHSKYIWDLLKDKVVDDTGALKLSKLMRENMHYILSIFSFLAEKGYKDFLIKYFLHPEYANYSIKFEGFDPITGLYKKMTKTKGIKKQYKNNAERYIRISFESLEQYSLKKNRNLKKRLTDEAESSLKETIRDLENGDEKKALLRLHKTFKIVAKNLVKKFS